jgi:hypothetical protein
VSVAPSDLQLALIAAGALGVALVWGYNVWQERQHRKTAERIFNGGQGDALAEDGGQRTEDGGQGTEDRERQEPRIADASGVSETPPVATAPTVDGADASTVAPAATPGEALPAECADAVADCVLRLFAVEPLSAPAMFAMQNAWAGGLSKPLHWLVRDEAAGDEAWRPVGVDDTGRYRDWVVALQLVDRRGAVSDAELGRFFDGVQQLAQQTAATLELPSRGEVVMRAAALDEFCAAVDIQFVLHVVEAAGGVFAGTKLRGVAEAAGLALESDGVFRARDEAGGELFTLANLGAERFAADSIRSLATHGLTLSLDVPRVSDGALAFDRMLAVARQLESTLGGMLVDAQRAPLADAMIDAIRAKTAELQQRMRDGAIAPGGTRALRLFS